METVRFDDVEAHRAAAERLFETLLRTLTALLPDADIQHVGSTALPRGLTKGDLDIQVRVPAARFEASCDALAAHYSLNEGGFRGHGGRSFKDDHTTPPMGVHVTVIDGACDFQWRFRDLMLRRPDLCEAYDDIKRRFQGGDMDAYRVEKGRFFEGLAAMEGISLPE